MSGHLIGVAALGRVRLGELVAMLLFLDGAVERLFEDGLGVNHLKLGPKILGMMGDGAAVGAATGIGKGKVLVGNFLCKGAPVYVLVAVGCIGVMGGIVAIKY